MLILLLLEMLLPPDQWQVVAEYALPREPRRIDAVIVRCVDVRDWHPEYLRSLLDDPLTHNLVHFKGTTDDLGRADARQLLSDAYQYMALEGMQSPAEISLRAVAPTLTPALSRAGRSARRRAGGDDRARRSPGVARVLAAAWCSSRTTSPRSCCSRCPTRPCARCPTATSPPWPNTFGRASACASRADPTARPHPAQAARRQRSPDPARLTPASGSKPSLRRSTSRWHEV